MRALFLSLLIFILFVTTLLACTSAQGAFVIKGIPCAMHYACQAIQPYADTCMPGGESDAGR